MAGSFQNEIPAARINLKLAVDKGGARKKTELPLRMLVVGDLSSSRHEGRVVDREKISVNKNNFGQVMKSMALKLDYTVENCLSGEGELPVSLDIDSMDSFHPESVAKAIPQIGRLLAARNLIKDLKSNLLDNRAFRKRLEEILSNPDATRALHEQLKQLTIDDTTPTTTEE